MTEDYILIQSAYAGDDSPAYSQGNTPDNTLLFTFHYTLPYEQFEQLKELQLEERSKNPFGRDYFLAIDLTEWLCHTDEEYFEITIKYLTDMKSNRKYIFMANSRDETAIKNLHIKLRTYMNGSCCLDEHWSDKSGIIKIINEISHFDASAAEAFAGILLRPEFDQYRSRCFIKKVTDEILHEKAGRVTIEVFEKYADDVNSLISLLANEKINIREDMYVIK